MSRRIVIASTIIATALFAAVPVGAQSAPRAVVISAAEQTAIDRAMERAHRIYAYDQAAWHGTDDMLARARDIADRIGGWITDGPSDAPTLIFYSRDPQPVPLYLANFAGGRIRESRKLTEADAALLTPARRRLIGAIATARAAITKSGVRPCADKPFNTVALPPSEPGGPIAVYFLTPQTTISAIPMGGHYLVEIDANDAPGPVRRFTNACIPAPIEQPKGKPVALTVTSVLDPVPTEIHGFSAMAARLPVIVIAPDRRLWVVTPAASGPTVRSVQAK